MHTCHWRGAQLCFRHKWRKLVTGSLLLHCIDGYSCLRYWIEIFSAVFQVLDWSFLVLHFDGNVCNWIPKVIWPRMDWFGLILFFFCWKKASFVDFISVWTEVCKKCSIVILFWPHQIFSMFSLRGSLVCSSKMLVLFGHRILQYRLMSFSNALQLYLLCMCVFPSSFAARYTRFLTRWHYLRTLVTLQFAGKRPQMQFTCVTCSLPVKRGNYTCYYAASTSRRIHAIALNKARKLQVTSPAWCRLTYLQFAGEFTRGVIAVCLQLQIILVRIAGFSACYCAGILSCVYSYFCLRLAGIFTCDSSVFACKLHVFLPAEAGNFAC